MGQTWVIGDIHGCLDSFLALLDKIQARECKAIYLCGDLINRGPKSAQTLEFLRTTDLPIECILGNHDIAFIAYTLNIFKKVNSDDHYEQLKSDPRHTVWVDWLRKLPFYKKTSQVLITHAGLYPYWSIEKNLHYADKLHELFTDRDYEQHFRELWKHSNASCSETNTLSFALNVLTRMRYLKSDGQLCLKVKGLASPDQESTLQPWFNVFPKTKQVILFGHWSALRGQTGREDIHCLDLGCVWKEELCAYSIETGEKIQQQACD